MVTRKGLLKVIGVVVGMALLAFTLHAAGFGTQVEVKEIDGVLKNVLVK